MPSSLYPQLMTTKMKSGHTEYAYVHFASYMLLLVRQGWCRSILLSIVMVRLGHML
jgi:hypothetical protein